MLDNCINKDSNNIQKNNKMVKKLDNIRHNIGSNTN